MHCMCECAREHASKIDEVFLRDVIMNFVLAGRDTTALAMTWAVHLIATHPEVEAKVCMILIQLMCDVDVMCGWAGA
jgi:cytochrome P450